MYVDFKGKFPFLYSGSKLLKELEFIKESIQEIETRVRICLITFVFAVMGSMEPAELARQ